MPQRVAYPEIETGGKHTGRTELVPARSVRGDDGSRLREAVSLVHRDADGAKKLLQLDIQKGSASYKVLHPSSKPFPDPAEQERVKESAEGAQEFSPSLAAAEAIGVVRECHGQSRGKQQTRSPPLRPHARLHGLPEVLRKRRNTEQKRRSHLPDIPGDIAESLIRSFPPLDAGDAASAHREGVDPVGVRKRMVPGKDQERAEPVGERIQGNALLDVRRVVSVCQYDSLGICNRAGGIADIRGIAFAHRAPDSIDVAIVRSEPLLPCFED